MPETACPECGHTPVGDESCPSCGATFRDLPAWKRPKALTHGDAVLTRDEEEGDETHFEAVDQGSVAHNPWAIATAVACLSGYWGLRVAGVAGARVFEPRLLWVGVFLPIPVVLAMITRRGGRGWAVMALPFGAALAILVAWPALLPAPVIVALAHFTPLLGVFGDPGRPRRILALAVTVLLLGTALTLDVVRGTTNEHLFSNAESRVALHLPGSMRALSRIEAEAYCGVPKEGLAASFGDPDERIGGVLVVTQDSSLGDFIARETREMAITSREKWDEEAVGALGRLGPELDEVEITTNDQPRKGVVAFAQTPDGRNVALLVSGSPAAFPRVRIVFRDVAAGLDLHLR